MRQIPCSRRTDVCFVAIALNVTTATGVSDNAVVKLGSGERYTLDYGYCIGCGICAMECLCGAIALVPEAI